MKRYWIATILSIFFILQVSMIKADEEAINGENVQQE